jgi:hypothetical protein
MAFITHGHNHYFALRRRVAGRIDGVAGSPGASMASPGRRAHRWRRRVAGRIDGVAGSPGASIARINAWNVCAREQKTAACQITITLYQFGDYSDCDYKTISSQPCVNRKRVKSR